MSRESLVFLIGLAVLLVPFTGLARDTKELIYVGSGALLLILGYLLRRAAFFRSLDDGNGGRRGDAFIESTDQVSSVQPETDSIDGWDDEVESRDI